MHCYAEPGNMDLMQRHKRLHFMFCENNCYTIVWDSGGLIQTVVTCVGF